MARYTVEKRVFWGFAGKSRKNYRRKFFGMTVPVTVGIHKLS
jgi:hypothetical protein